MEVAATVDELLAAQQQVKEVEVEDSVVRYLLTIVRSTRDYEGIEIGASTRSALALYRLSQSVAVMNERGFVIPDDIKQAAPYVLSHRLLLNAQGRMTGGTGIEIVQNILMETPVPIR
jgi:MoxR-like ATPase